MFMWPVCWSVVVPFAMLPSTAGKHNKHNHNTLPHRPHKHTLYDIPPLLSAFQVTQDESKKLPDDGRLLPKHVGACIMNKGVVQFSA
jgi:hypothetical protein